MSDAVHLWEMSRKVRTVPTNQFLEGIPRAKYAGFDSERPDKPSTCLEGTRTAILQNIVDWITETDPAAPQLFWLSGIAGVGKTAVACTIAGLMQNLGLLGAQFCFSRRGEAELRDPALVFPTIAYQLARFDREFGRRITAALEADPEAPYASLKQQLDRLIVRPLKDLERDPKRVVVLVFDAFDECETRGAKEILQLLVAALGSLPFFMKIFITSRPVHHIQSILMEPWTKVRSAALEISVAKGDILHFLRHGLHKLGEERGLPGGWITESEISLLAEKAGILFVSARTSLRFLENGPDLRQQLRTLLMSITSPSTTGPNKGSPWSEMDHQYMQLILETIPRENSHEVAASLRQTIGTIILLRDPLPMYSLEDLIGLDDEPRYLLRHLRSVIFLPPSPDDCPRLYDSSFGEFLQDHSRCTDDLLWIDTEQHERRMAQRCLETLTIMLSKNGLRGLDPFLLNNQIQDLAMKVQENFSPVLQYSCRYWASHLCAAHGDADGFVLNALAAFASTSLLLWLEAMSWMGEVRLAASSLENAIIWVVSAGRSSAF